MHSRTAFLLSVLGLTVGSIHAHAFPLPGPLVRSHMNVPEVEAVDIVLYRDMAWVREVRRQFVAEGTSDVELPSLPRIEPYTPAVRAVDGLGQFDVLSVDCQREAVSTVIARVDAHGGDRKIEVSYLVPELVWTPNYVLMLAPQGAKAQLTASAFIVNRSGRSFAHANLRLVSGLASRESGSASNPETDPLATPVPLAQPVDGDRRPLLELQGIDIAPAAVQHGQTKLVEIMQATAVPVRVEHFVTFTNSCGDMTQEDVTAGLIVAFRNDRASGLGDHLATGMLTVKSVSFDSTINLIGRASIPETLPGGLVNVFVGYSRDVTATRTVVDADGDRRAHEDEYTYKVVLTNRTPDPVVVTVRDPRSKKIIESSHPFTGRGQHASCAVPIPANATAEVVYTAKYRCR